MGNTRQILCLFVCNHGIKELITHYHDSGYSQYYFHYHSALICVHTTYGTYVRNTTHTYICMYNVFKLLRNNITYEVKGLHCVHISTLAWFSSVRYGTETRCIHTTQFRTKNYTVAEAHIVK